MKKMLTSINLFACLLLISLCSYAQEKEAQVTMTAIRSGKGGTGKRLVAEFKNEGTNSVTATGELYTVNGVSFTVYLAGQGSSSRVKAYEDDLAVPNNGKVKIKFIHLSDAAPSDINIKNGAGDDLVTNISRNIQSEYKYVDPGTLSLKLYGTASRNNIGSFDITDLQSGKIYTLYLTGSTDATLAVNKVLHN